MKELMLVAMLLQSSVSSQAGTGIVSGLVRTEDGKPAANVRVAAMSAKDTTTPDGSALLGITSSDESGNYRIENIPPGPYYIVAGRVDRPTFYPGAEQITAAKTISIASGALLGEINFTVSAASARVESSDLFGLSAPATSPYLQLSGKMVSESGGVFVALPNSVVMLSRSSSTIPTTIRVRRDGTFSFTLDTTYGPQRVSVNLPAGYSVKSMTLDSTDLLTQPLTLVPGSPFGQMQIMVAVPELTKIRGRVVNPATGVSISGADVTLSDANGNKSRAKSSMDGSFEFLGAAPGSYFIDVGLMFYIFQQRTIEMEDRDMNLVLEMYQP